MKKILAVVLSFAMILSMTVCAFAAEAPAANSADVDAWTAYYTEILTDETLDADAKIDAVMDNIPTDPSIAVSALTGSLSAAQAAGVDTSELTVAMVNKLEEEYGINIEDMMDEDIDGDGYVGENKKPVSPTDVEGWTAYYTILLGQATTDPTAIGDVVSEIAGDVLNGNIDMDTFTSAFPAAVAAVGGDVVNQVVWGVEGLINMDLNSDGYIGKPDGSIDDPELPEDPDDGSSGIGGFLDTILGILGSIGDMLFGGGDDNPDPTVPGDDDDSLWGDEGDDWGDDNSTIPDTGDTTVFAVAAVALAAGAALVMTRKKSEDAE